MITREEITALARLAKLEIPEADFDGFANDFSDIIDFANAINAEVVGGAAELREVGGGSVWLEELRNDEVQPSLPEKSITSGADEENGCFRVRRVVR